MIAMQGPFHVAKLTSAIEDHDTDIPELARPILSLLVEQLRSLDERVAVLDHELARRVKKDAEVKRLMTIPGIGPITATAFVALAPTGVPAPTGHDKTSIVCFQREDRPGSLHAILSEFAARSINLTKLESRPTKSGLGNYCFLIDLEGHVADEVVADCLRVLHAELAEVKFLGSYPAAGEHGPEQRRQADAAWQAADDWLDGLRSAID